MGVIAHLAETTVATAPTVNTSELTSNIKTLLGSVFTVDNLVTIITTALGMTVGFFIFWFAYRFIKGKATKAMLKGKL